MGINMSGSINRQFDFKNNAKFCIIGKQKSGKTSIVREYMTNNKGLLKTVYYMGKDEDTYRENVYPYTPVSNNSYLLSDTNKGDYGEFLEKFIETERVNEKIYRTSLGEKAPLSLLIIDEVIDDLPKERVESLLQNSRHYRTPIIIVSETLPNITSTAQVNIDYWFLAGTQDNKEIDQYYDRVFGKYPNFNSFKSAVKSLTKYKFLIYENNLEWISTKMMKDIYYHFECKKLEYSGSLPTQYYSPYEDRLLHKANNDPIFQWILMGYYVTEEMQIEI